MVAMIASTVTTCTRLQPNIATCTPGHCQGAQDLSAPATPHRVHGLWNICVSSYTSLLCNLLFIAQAFIWVGICVHWNEAVTSFIYLLQLACRIPSKFFTLTWRWAKVFFWGAGSIVECFYNRHWWYWRCGMLVFAKHTKYIKLQSKASRSDKTNTIILSVILHLKARN